MMHMLLLALVLFAVADALTTVRALGGGAYEANPVAAWLIRQIGVIPAMLAAKIVCSGLVLLVAAQWPWFGALAVAGYCYVLYNNIKVLRAQHA